MTAKPESVESLCAKLATLSKGLAADILTAHRAELAEALKEPTDEELAARTTLMGGRWEYWRELAHDLFQSRRRKHGVDK